MTETERQLYLAAAAAIAALLALIWLTGALAGLLFGSGVPEIGMSDLGMTALRLPLHLTEPRDAWPRGARSALPGAAGFYLSAMLIGAALAGLALLARRASKRVALPQLGKRRWQVPTARWATLRDLASLRVPKPQRGRLTLGKFAGTLLAAEERQSVIAFAPTGTHKTSGLVIPALLEWQGPALVTTVKGDLLPQTIEHREKRGEAMVFDPMQVSGDGSTQATPLEEAKTWQGARQVAHWLCDSAQAGKEGLQEAGFWYATAAKLLAPMLFAAARSERTMADVVRWLDEGPTLNREEIEKTLGKVDSLAAMQAWKASRHREKKQLSSIYTTAETILSVFADPRVQEETAEAAYTPARLLNGKPNTLYLCAPLHQQERLRPLFSMIVQELLNFAYERAATQGPLDPPLLLLLDEAANIAPIPSLDAVASTGAGQGIQLLTIFQDLAQLETVYGPGRAETIFNNHRAKMIGTGISDRKTLSLVSHISGVAEFEQRSRSSGDKGHRSETEGKTYRDLAPANVVRESPPGSALLVYHNLPLAKVSLRPWFEENSLRNEEKTCAHSQNNADPATLGRPFQRDDTVPLREDIDQRAEKERDARLSFVIPRKARIRADMPSLYRVQ